MPRWRRTSVRCERSKSSLLARTTCTCPPHSCTLFSIVDAYFFSQEQLEQLAAEKLAVEERAAEQAETLRQLTEANATLSSRALQLAEDAAAAQEELRAVKAVSEREQAQRLALLEEINLVQTENGTLRQQLRALGKL